MTETHALLQKKDGLGDCEPQAVVISGWRLRTCTVSSELEMKTELQSSGGHTDSDPHSGKDLQTSSSDQEQAALVLKGHLSPQQVLADGMTLEHKSLPPSSLFQFFDFFFGAPLERQ